MNSILEQTLLESMERLSAGETIDQIVESHPEMADELRPLLKTAQLLSQGSPPHSVKAQQRSRQQFLQRANTLKVSNERASLWQWPQLLKPIAALALIVLMFAVSLIGVSTNALPGDRLYGTKLWVESVRLDQANDPQTVQRLEARFKQERIREIEALLRAGRTADVTFDGTINRQNRGMVEVAGIPVQLTAESEIVGVPMVQSIVRINGRTQDGILTAQKVTVLSTPPLDEVDEPEEDDGETAVPSSNDNINDEEDPSDNSDDINTNDSNTNDDNNVNNDDDSDDISDDDSDSGEDNDNNDDGEDDNDDDDDNDNDDDGSDSGGSGSNDSDDDDGDNSGSGSSGNNNNDNDSDDDGSGTGSSGDDDNDNDSDNDGDGGNDNDDDDDGDDSGSGSSGGDDNDNDDDDNDDDSGSGSNESGDDDDEDEEDDDSGGGDDDDEDD